jgi:hypothetical protein
MSVKNEQLRKLVEQLVRKEVQAQLPRLVKEVMANLILESNIGESYSEPRPIRETVGLDDEFEEYPTMGKRVMDTSHLSSMMGAPSLNSGMRPDANLITIDSAMTENGNQIPISPNQIPKEVLKAMNKDYSQILKKLNINTK